MMTIKGKGISDRIAAGRLYFAKKKKLDIKKYAVDDTAAEMERYHKGLCEAYRQLDELYEKACRVVGEDDAMIFRIHKMMLEDEDCIRATEKIIQTQSLNAEYAVKTVTNKLTEEFLGMNDEYMRARAEDVNDISERLLMALLGERSEAIEADEPVIVAADDIPPSRMMQLDSENVLGIIAFYGSEKSHASILARMMKLPAVVNSGVVDEAFSGCMAVVNGAEGTVIIEPDERTLAEARAAAENHDTLHEETCPSASINIHALAIAPPDVIRVRETVRALDAAGKL